MQYDMPNLKFQNIQRQSAWAPGNTGSSLPKRDVLSKSTQCDVNILQNVLINMLIYLIGPSHSPQHLHGRHCSLVVRAAVYCKKPKRDQKSKDAKEVHITEAIAWLHADPTHKITASKRQFLMIITVLYIPLLLLYIHSNLLMISVPYNLHISIDHSIYS